jgi:hypothetical protein
MITRLTDKLKSHIALGALLLICLSIMVPAYAAALSVPLSVKDRSGLDRTNEPTTYGVPLKKPANILSTDSLGIFDSNGKEVDAQFHILSRYDGPPNDRSKPIRMLLCDIQADVGASRAAVYYLKDNGSGTANDDIVAEDASHVTLTTGKMVMKIRKSGYFNLFDEVYIDADNDGQVDDQVVSSQPDAGVVVKSGGTVYASYNLAPSVVSIEENGPVKAVVKVRGYYADDAGNNLTPPRGDTGLEYVIRITAYKNKSFVRIFHTMASENYGWAYSPSYPAHNIDLDWVKFSTQLNLEPSKTVQFEGYSDTSNGATYDLLQSHSEKQQNESGNFHYSLKKNGSQVSAGDRYDSYVDLGDSKKGLMAASRWFWQNWPKGVSISNNRLDFYLWPDVSENHVFIGSIYKSHELLYSFHGAGDNDFADEMATLKKRLLLLAPDDYYASTNFIDYVPPDNLSSSHTFSGGEKLQTAIDLWDASIRSKFDSRFATGSRKDTFNSLRELRPIKWNGGVFDGQWINWYGWLDFGDFPRGSNYGFPALHYNWDYIALIHGLRFADYGMIELGEQMARHRADVDIVHDPNGTDEAGSWDEDFNRGGHRYEADAHYQRGNWNYASPASNDPHGAAHSWAKGIVLQYLLTGNEYYRDVLDQIGAHFLYAYSENGNPDWSCKNAPCWDTGESRQVTRAIEIVTDLWRVTGDAAYLTLMKNIFNNSVLAVLEVKKDGFPQGYLKYPTARDWCCNQSCDAHMLYEAIATKPFISLYYELTGANWTSDANKVLEFMKRKSNWFKNSVFKNYSTSDCGVYNRGKYFPYVVKLDWRENCKWRGTAYDDISYSFVQADLFAFIYKETGEVEWLNLARSVFKDGMLYSRSGFQPVNLDASPTVDGFPSYPYTAWLKEGKVRHKPMYYLYVEWLENGQPPLSPTGLEIKSD